MGAVAAVTATPSTTLPTQYVGSDREVYGTLVFGASSDTYATGGATISPAQVGLSGIKTMRVTARAGYLASYLASTGKVLVYRQSAATSALTEPNAVDISGVTFEYVARGF